MELQNEIRTIQIEQNAMKREKDAVIAAVAAAYKTMAESGTKAPDSGKKTNYTKEHPDRHAAVVLTATPTFIALKKLANNQDVIWWVAKHVEALAADDKPE